MHPRKIPFLQSSGSLHNAKPRPAFPVLAARFLRPSFTMGAPPGEGGAGRRGPGGPVGLRLSRDASGAMLFDEAPLGLSTAESAISPASRARCLKPYSARPPVGGHFQALDPFLRTALGSRAYPPLSGPGRSARSMARCAPGPPCPSGDAQQARRDRAASAVATRVCVLHPVATTAPDPHFRTPPEAPRGSRQSHRIAKDVAQFGSNGFCNEIILLG